MGIRGWLLFYSAKKIDDFFRADRCHMVGIHPYIVPPDTIFEIFCIIISVIMLVSMEGDGAFSTTVPFQDRIVK